MNKVFLGLSFALALSIISFYIYYLKNESLKLKSENINLKRDIKNINKSNEIIKNIIKKKEENKKSIESVYKYNDLLNYFNNHFMQYNKSTK